MADEKATVTEKLPTAVEFERALAFITEKEPEKWSPIINSITVAALKKVEELETNLKKLVILLLKTGVIKGGATAAPSAESAPASPAAEAAPAAFVVPPGTGNPRTGADGRPLTPAEAAVEDMMDTAEVDNSQPAPTIGSQGPAQKRNGKVQPAATSNGNRVGADGKPLTAAEAAVEDMMDSAVVDNS